MRFTPPAAPEARREEKEHRLKDLITSHLPRAETSVGANELLIVARSLDSPIMSAVGALANELRAACVNTRAIVAIMERSEAHDFRAALPDLAIELRHARRARLIEAHEQLVIGSCCWYGDSMRRDPLKRDAYESTHVDNPEMVRLARLAFDRLWGAADTTVPAGTGLSAPRIEAIAASLRRHMASRPGKA